MLDVDHGTYPFVTSSSATARRRVHGLGRRADRASTGSSASPRRTRRASARGRSPPSCWTTTASGCARPAASSARRPAGRAAPAGTTPWSSGTPRASTGSRTSSLTKLDVLTGPRHDPGLRGVRRGRPPVRRDARDQSDFHHATPIYEYLRRLDGGHQRRARVRRPAGQRAALPAVPRGDLGCADQRRSASVRAVRRRSSGTTCSADGGPTVAVRRGRPPPAPAPRRTSGRASSSTMRGGRRDRVQDGGDADDGGADEHVGSRPLLRDEPAEQRADRHEAVAEGPAGAATRPSMPGGDHALAQRLRDRRCRWC